MGKIFKRGNKFKQKDQKKRRPAKRRTSPGELVDPVLYIGGLEPEKYPTLPLENSKDKKIEEEVENPLNKR
jgi:hypothetical protein